MADKASMTDLIAKTIQTATVTNERDSQSTPKAIVDDPAECRQLAVAILQAVQGAGYVIQNAANQTIA